VAAAAVVERGATRHEKNIFFPSAAVGLAAALLSPTAVWAQAKYASPEAAADACSTPCPTDSAKAKANVLGKEWQKLMPPDGVDPATARPSSTR
jgi:hypothetical protein